MDTIDYYNKYASKIFEDTVDRDTEELREEFLSHLQPGDTILDLGCGSGRDSLAFYDLGYDVTPLDASEEMCKLAEIHTGLEVLQISYEDMEFNEAFDGVWGCGALIHEPEDELEGILDKLADGLCQKGVLFLSFLEGDLRESEADVISVSIRRSSWSEFCARRADLRLFACGAQRKRDMTAENVG